MSKIEFDAEINIGEGGGAYVNFPYDVQEVFGKKGQIKVICTIDGVPYRGSLARMKGECHMLGILKEIRKTIGKQPGDTVHIILEEDLGPRIITPPDDFKSILEHNPEALRIFNGLSYTCQKEYVVWIESAKKIETRMNRLTKSIEMILNGKKNP
jgi:bifunctional DNA-binding transcriptional regulator/antitoxin component of YhaV-PrlF toxin-antitoxin module